MFSYVQVTVVDYSSAQLAQKNSLLSGVGIEAFLSSAQTLLTVCQNSVYELSYWKTAILILPTGRSISSNISFHAVASLVLPRTKKTLLTDRSSMPNHRFETPKPAVHRNDTVRSVS